MTSNPAACARCRYEIQAGPDAIRIHLARGLCNFCWHGAKKTGTLADFERAVRTRDEVMADWAVLRVEGYTKRQAAERLGMKFPAFEKAYERARRAGDSRAIPAARRCPRVAVGPRARSGSEAA